VKARILRSTLALAALATPVFAQPSEPAPTEAPVLETPAATAAPVEAPAAPAAEAPKVDDDDILASLGLDPNAPMFDDKLQIYGFADFNYTYYRFPSDLLPDARSFSVGSVNLYVRKNLSASWRTLTEVRFLFAPNGSLPASGSGLELENTEATDVANFERPIAWGGISIERVHVEHDLAPWLTVRAGRFLTPYGIWNMDHGSPVIIGTARPYIVGEQFFPEHQTGLQLFGTKTVDEYRFEYHATLSNGRNTFEATRDVDGKLAYGGRLAVTAPVAGTLQLGISGYHGRASEPTSLLDAGPSFDETALGVDAAWDRGGFHAQAEVLVQDRKFLDGRRAKGAVGFAPDGRAFGVYGLAGYRFSSLWNIMPYGLVQHYTPHDPSTVGKEILGVEAGINLRPLPSVVLKGSYVHAVFGDGGLLSGAGDFFAAQVAWVF
jgi:hypothetical protein